MQCGWRIADEVTGEDTTCGRGRDGGSQGSMLTVSRQAGLESRLQKSELEPSLFILSFTWFIYTMKALHNHRA